MYRSGRQSFGPGLTPAIKNLLIANGIVFGIMFLIPSLGNYIFYYFSLIPANTIFNFEIWRVFSYMFLHGGIFHILMNLYVLWMFGSELERMWGSKEFYRYFLITGLIAGFVILLANFGNNTQTIGASGAVSGILMANLLFFPDNEVYILPFPFPIKMKYMILFFAVLETFQAISMNDQISHSGHFGGALGGYLYLRSKYGPQIPKITELFKKKRY